MGLFELFEIGFFHSLWNFANPALSILTYLYILLGFLVEILLQMKCKNNFFKFLPISLCVTGIILSEVLFSLITGWERLAISIFYGLTLCFLTGTLIAKFVYWIRRNNKSF